MEPEDKPLEEKHLNGQELAANASEELAPEFAKMEEEASRRAARDMRVAALTIVLACVGVCVAIALVILIGHIQLF